MFCVTLMLPFGDDNTDNCDDLASTVIKAIYSVFKA